MKYILAIDQSTSGTKAVLIDENGEIVEVHKKKHKQFYPQANWVEQDAEQIWQNVVDLIQTAPASFGVSQQDILAIGITNQRETSLLWDRKTGKPIGNAVSWQCQRGVEICENLSEYREIVREKTGIPLSAYYSAAKISWLLQNTPNISNLISQDSLCAGTIDSYLVFRLTNGENFLTDHSNASRTQLYNLKTHDWDDELLNIFGVPRSIMADIVFSDSMVGFIADSILEGKVPICSLIGDSHAALFGQGCLEPKMAKATYGTGSSVMVNIGTEYKIPPQGITTSVAFGIDKQIYYAFEGNVNSSGDTLEWIVNECELAASVKEIFDVSEITPSSEGVSLIPAFTGLGAPFYRPHTKAAIVGIGRGTTRKHILRAGFESVVLQNYSVIDAMKIDIKELRVDGGPTGSDTLMQLQANLINRPVVRSIRQEISALGAAYLAGINIGLFNDFNSIPATKRTGKKFLPETNKDYSPMITLWNKAIELVSSTT